MREAVTLPDRPAPPPLAPGPLKGFGANWTSGRDYRMGAYRGGVEFLRDQILENKTDFLFIKK